MAVRRADSPGSMGALPGPRPKVAEESRVRNEHRPNAGEKSRGRDERRPNAGEENRGRDESRPKETEENRAREEKRWPKETEWSRRFVEPSRVASVPDPRSLFQTPSSTIPESSVILHPLVL
ncbi:hypothetical protein TREES_T100018434 [Tupaia chinensis]|uniref:Uncharacterized protein n=1 Tax=Tupaia chinensis TaxID=246437 RepID=L9KXK4_TUPCH|nr:hypothetical protein TREES_T100018434 [Tupaia chinensis]